MRPRRACEEVRRFDPSVGSSSSGQNQLEGPPIAINLDRYNLVD